MSDEREFRVRLSPDAPEIVIKRDDIISSLCARIAALEAEVDCPLGLDRGLWELCSAGTCPTCLAARLKTAEAERTRLEAEVARLREARAYSVTPALDAK